MKKMIIAIVLYTLVAMAFSGCMTAAHAGHRSASSQHSGGCH